MSGEKPSSDKECDSSSYLENNIPQTANHKSREENENLSGRNGVQSQEVPSSPIPSTCPSPPVKKEDLSCNNDGSGGPSIVCDDAVSSSPPNL